MPRKKPAPEDEPVRTTISLPYYIGQAAGVFESTHTELALKGFSDLLARALGDYMERHHPGLIAEVKRELQAAAKLKAAAEQPQGKYPAADAISRLASEILNPAPPKPRGPNRAPHK